MLPGILLGEVPLKVGVNEGIEVPVHHPDHIVGFVTGPGVFDQRIGVEDVGTNL